MNSRRLFQLGCFSLVCMMLAWGTGCSEPNLIDRVSFEAPEYNRVFDNSSSILRDNRIPPGRQDRRFGYISSKPVEASHLFNAFRGDHSTFYQVMESSGNHQRRIVRIWMRPTGAGPEEVAEPELRQKILAYRAGFALDDEGNVKMPTTQQAPEIYNESYDLKVQVMIQRTSDPYRQLSNRYGGGLAGTSSKVEVKKPDVWYDFREDPELADRIIRLIAKRSGLVVPPASLDDE